MKKLVSVLLSFVLCLCLLVFSMENAPNRNGTPDDPNLITVDPEIPEESVQPMNDDEGPGERNENT